MFPISQFLSLESGDASLISSALSRKNKLPRTLVGGEVNQKQRL